MRLFIDSDVIISSLLSSKGASYTLLHSTQVTCYISSLSQKEIQIVLKKLGHSSQEIEQLSKEKLQTIPLSENIRPKEEKKFQKYVFDENDSHIVWGAVA